MNETRTMATQGIVSIEVQRRELEMFKSRLVVYAGIDGIDQLLEEYQRIVNEYDALDKGDQSEVDTFNDDILSVKSQIFLKILELAK